MRDRQDQRHRHVGRVLGEDARRVRHRDAARQRDLHVDIVDAVAEIGDELEVGPNLREYGGVDLVGDGRDEHVGALHRLHELALGHRLVVEVEARVEELAHAGLDHPGEAARHHDERSLLHGPTLTVRPVPRQGTSPPVNPASARCGETPPRGGLDRPL